MAPPPIFAIRTRSDSYQIMRIVLGLGANMISAWGAPGQTLRSAIHELGVEGISIEARSPLYESAPLGTKPQPAFVNAVVIASSFLPPSALLEVLKRMERAAGRRHTRRWDPRPLDIDILDYAGRVINWPEPISRTLRHDARRQEGIHLSPTERTHGRPALVTPHPQLHLRAFVLQPLMDVLPRWHHPVTGESIKQLLSGLPVEAGEGHIQRKLADIA